MAKQLILMALLVSLQTCHTQTVAGDYLGNWEGKLPHPNSVNFELVVEKLAANSLQLTISNPSFQLVRKTSISNKDDIQIDIDEKTHFSLHYSDDEQSLLGFVTSGILMYHITLRKVADGSFSGTWNPLMIDRLESQAIYLSIENEGGDAVVAYPFFGDQRFTGTWANNFTHRDDVIDFRDFKTGLRFRATLVQSEIHLEILLAEATVATTTLVRSTSDWQFGVDAKSVQNTFRPAQLDDGWQTSSSEDAGIRKGRLENMITSIDAGELENTNSVLIASRNTLVFESYFSGFHAHIPHDQRSGSKSISSAMIGIGIAEGVLEGTDQKLYDCIPQQYQYTIDPSKSQIRLHDLLTMSAGLDVGGKASEGTYQDSDNWLKTVLEAPMANEPGAYTDYGSANPYLLGVCLDQKLDMPLEHYMDRRLLAPLGISNYII